ncbi:MAG: hypothetical protein VXZ54_05595, partial [Planctomycetota bacterium]|nr:hypothetical protein [Planctomycetota bacterium]
MKEKRQVGWVFLIVTLLLGSASAGDDPKDRPIRALLITGGCCHDYPFQARQLIQAAKKRDL